MKKLFDEGQVIKDHRPQYQVHLLFFHKLDEDKYLKACVKATQNGNELYLQTLHFISGKHHATIEERGILLREPKEDKKYIRMFLAEYIHK